VSNGTVSPDALRGILLAGNVYPDIVATAVDDAKAIRKYDAVERILIHLEGQSPPSEFHSYGAKVVPFYNYLQAAFVLHEDSRIRAEHVLDVASELAAEHRFDAEQLARSFREIYKRGHLAGSGIDSLRRALSSRDSATSGTMIEMLDRIQEFRDNEQPSSTHAAINVNYMDLVRHHNQRRTAKH
jgi:hypothetical protein